MGAYRCRYDNCIDTVVFNQLFVIGNSSNIGMTPSSHRNFCGVAVANRDHLRTLGICKVAYKVGPPIPEADYTDAHRSREQAKIYICHPRYLVKTLGHHAAPTLLFAELL